MAKKELVIWEESVYTDLEKMAEELKADNFYQEEYGKQDDEFWLDLAKETWDNYLDDERMNLDKELDTEVVVFAKIGLWDGIRVAFKRLKSNNLNSFLKSFMDGDRRFYYDGYNICGSETHHDGTNYYTFRRMKPGKSAEILESKFCSGIITETNVKFYMHRYTQSIAEPVKKIYGW